MRPRSDRSGRASQQCRCQPGAPSAVGSRCSATARRTWRGSGPVSMRQRMGSCAGSSGRRHCCRTSTSGLNPCPSHSPARPLSLPLGRQAEPRKARPRRSEDRIAISTSGFPLDLRNLFTVRPAQRRHTYITRTSAPPVRYQEAFCHNSVAFGVFTGARVSPLP